MQGLAREKAECLALLADAFHLADQRTYAAITQEVIIYPGRELLISDEVKVKFYSLKCENNEQNIEGFINYLQSCEFLLLRFLN